MEYKKTLNMQKSGFPMRGNLPNREPAMLEPSGRKWTYTAKC